MTIVEVLVAVLILAIGAGAAVTAFAVPERSTRVSERELAATTIAERELERLVGRPWQNIATTALPTHQADSDTENPADPRFYVTGTSFAIKKNYSNSSSGDIVSGGEPLVPALAAPAGVPQSEATSTASGDPAGTIYRFVTYRNETCAATLPGNLLKVPLQQVVSLLGGLTNLLDGLLGGILNGGLNVMCGARNDAKRITVAVKLDSVAGGAGPSRPVYVSTIVPNPNAGVTAANGSLSFGRSCTYVAGIPLCS